MSFSQEKPSRELQNLRTNLLEIGVAAEQAVADSLHSFLNRDLDLAASIVLQDDAIDKLGTNIEARCLGLLAIQQPRASDLRLLGSALKMATDLEQVGDHAVAIAQIASQLNMDIRSQAKDKITKLGCKAQEILHGTLEAFGAHDLLAADRIIAEASIINRLYAGIQIEVQNSIGRNPASAFRAYHLGFAAYHIERICSHCIEIAKRVEFIEAGRQKGKQGREPSMYVSINMPIVYSHLTPSDLSEDEEETLLQRKWTEKN